MRRLALATAAAALVAPVLADEWVWLGNDTTGNSYHYHLGRTEFPGQKNALTWVRTTYKSPQKLTLADGKVVTYRSLVTHMGISCDAGVYANNESFYYATVGGAAVYSSGYGGSGLRAPPDSVAEHIVRTMCADSRAK